MSRYCYSKGTCLLGYEKVRDVFERNLRNGIEDRAQCCVYVKGIKVVDLWGTSPETPSIERENFKYRADAVQNVFSTTKVLTSVVIAMLVDRGFLQYDQLVSSIWEEFDCEGKGSTTVAMVMRHEAGLHRLNKTIASEDLTPERIRSGVVSDIIAQQRPRHRPGAKRIYHALTRGWIVNEIVRRVDPKGRTVGEFLRDEVAEPLGLGEELFIGIPEKYHHKIAPLKSPKMWYTWSQLALPTYLGGGAVPCSIDMLRWAILAGVPLYQTLTSTGLASTALGAVRLLYRNKGRSKKKPNADMEVKEFPGSIPWPTESFNAASVRRGEVPSANGHCSARALAKVAASIVEGGALEGCHRILSKAGIREAHAGVVKKFMFRALPTNFTNAGFNIFREKKRGEGRDGFVGWLGLGGSVMQWHPGRRVGFAYTMNMLELTPTNERGRELQAIVLKCAKKIENRHPSHSRL